MDNYDPRGVSTYAESLMMKIAREEEPIVVFRNRGSKSKSETYTGGYVKDPVPGISKNVFVLDLTSTYSFIIKTFNIGIETFREDKTGEILAPHGSFINTRKSIAAKALDYLLKLRNEAKKIRDQYDPASREYKIWDGIQFSYKFILHAFYGCMGDESSRIYRREIAEDITLYCRAIIKEIEKYLTTFKNVKIIAADTDGLFIKIPDNIDKENLISITKLFKKKVNEMLEEWIPLEFRVPKEQNFIRIKVDRICDKVYFPSKKKSYGLRVIREGDKDVNYYHIKGFQCVKSSTPKFLKKIEEKVLKMIINEENFDKIKEFLEKEKEKLFSGKVDEELIQYMRLSKDPSKYNKKTRHAEVALKLKSMGYNISVGDKIAYISTGSEYFPWVPGMKLSNKFYQDFWNDRVIGILDDIDLDIDWKDFTKQTRLQDF